MSGDLRLQRYHMNGLGRVEKTIFFITGASGVGKTTLVNELKKKV